MTVSSATYLISQLLPEPQAGLLAGMLFGVRASLSPELYDALVTSGTLHIIALSGMNISILIGVVNLALLRIVKRPAANILSCGMIAAFIWFVGPSPSVIRAGIMGGITLLGVSLGRQLWPLLIWMLTIVIMLAFHPPWAGDLSFQLSVMATLGILLFGNKTPVDQKSFPRSMIYDLRSFLENDLRITLAAQVFTVPIIMFAFGRISLVSPLSNVLIGWLIAPVMTLGFLLVAVGSIWLPLGQIIAWLIWVLLAFMIQAVELTGKIPFASISF